MAKTGASSRKSEKVESKKLKVKKSAHKKYEVEEEDTDNLSDDEMQGEVKPQGESKSLYDVLGVPSAASIAEIKKAYRCLALKLHPDKNKDDEESKVKFQNLQHVYSILSDPEKRKIYDETGSVEGTELSGKDFAGWYDLYRSIYRKITVEDIMLFEREYRGSEEELNDLREYFSKYKGDMKKVFECVPCCDHDLDSHRFMKHINEQIEKGELKSFKVFSKWATAVEKTPEPKDPLSKSTTSRKRSSSSSSQAESADLFALIQSKQNSRANSLFESLERKYGTSISTKKTKMAHNEVSEEEFRAAQKRVREMVKMRGRKAK